MISSIINDRLARFSVLICNSCWIFKLYFEIYMLKNIWGLICLFVWLFSLRQNLMIIPADFIEYISGSTLINACPDSKFQRRIKDVV